MKDNNYTSHFMLFCTTYDSSGVTHVHLLRFSLSNSLNLKIKNLNLSL